MTADITLALEGTYPYVAGGVSSWVHQLLNAYPARTFSLIHIAPRPGTYGDRAFELPPNVVQLEDVYCSGARGAGRTYRRGTSRGRNRTRSRVLDAIRRIHLDESVDDSLLDDLSAGDLSADDLLHGNEAFALMRDELYPRLGPDAPFIDFFWHFRAMHLPLLRLLEARCPPAKVYHAVSTGYAGLVAAVASVKSRRPLVITEHGIYAREREIELARAEWIRDGDTSNRVARPSPLRKLWCHFFIMLSRIAYHRASRVITLSETNRRRQLRDGAAWDKTGVVPNGVDRVRFQTDGAGRNSDERARVGFVGRVVPIKDVITLIRACAMAIERAVLELWIVGPQDEDPRYAQRCHELVRTLDLEGHIRFLGPQPMTEIYPQLDAVVLTSISEGQPLAMLEAFAAGLPVVATDVGACRELIEGCDPDDRRTGPAGIVTRVANPRETAVALAYLAQNPRARRAMGDAGRARVAERYRQQQLVTRYDELYTTMVTS